MFDSQSALCTNTRKRLSAAVLFGALLLTASVTTTNAAERSFFDSIKAFFNIGTVSDEPDSNSFDVVPMSQTVAPGSVNDFSWTFAGTNSAYRPIFTFTIPEDWTDPQSADPNAPGYVSVDPGTCGAMLLSVVGDTITIRQGRRGCFNGQNFTINYFNATAPTPPTLPQTYTFTAYPSRHSPTVTVGFGTPSPTATSTSTPTNSPTNTPTGTPTGSPSGTPTHSPTPSHTPTSTPTGTATASVTPTRTATATATPTGTATSTATPTASATGTPECTPSTFTNSTEITIPDSGAASPYPSTITVDDLEGEITHVTVTLTGLTHTSPDNLDLLLVGPEGQNAIIMSDAGGNSDVSGITLTLDDSAALLLPDSSPLTTGTYRPANYGTGDTFPAPAPAPSGGSALSVFNETDPEGIWSLYVVDDATGDLGAFVGGWSITITTDEDDCGTPTATPTRTPTGTPSGTPTHSPTNTPTATPTGSPSGTPTHSPTNTPTATPTGSPSGTPTHSPTNTPTNTPTATPTSSPSGTPTGSATATPTATPTPGPPTVYWSRVRYQADESQVEEVTVVREGDLSGTTTVSVSTSDIDATGGTACTSGVDYISITDQTVTFAPGETEQSVFVTICGDTVREHTEKFSLTLSGPNVGSPDVAVVNIHDTANRFRGGSAICVTPGSPASLYPSTIMVNNAPAQIGSIRVSLFDMQNVAPDDLDILLVGPQGQNIVLMAGAGGTTPLTDPVTLTFSDAAGQVISDTDPLTSGEFEPTTYGSVSNFDPPAPAGPYNEPGSTVGGSGTQTLIGVYGLTDANGIWSLYVRNNGSSTGCIAGGWGIEFLGPTAGNATLSGRVTTADGRGIHNVVLTLTGDSLRSPMIARTRSFGHYSFDGLQTGETYVVTVRSRNYTFGTPSQVITLTDNLAEVNFQAEPR